MERIVKFLLWQKGGNIILVAGDDAIADMLASRYCKGGAREFDWDFIGKKIYGSPIEVKKVSVEELPEEYSGSMTLGRNLDGYRIGFDLGGSDRKCAAVVNGEVVYSEEVVWDPYFQKDPQYHIEGIQDSLERAAAHLPRVDAIGGSSAGVIINSEVRTSSLFRGVSQEDIEKTLGKVFRTLQKEKWNNIPFEVVNDGEVTALAGAMGMNDNAVLGVAMGTSEAAGYVDPEGHIKPWLNELAFAPVDYSEEGGVDEWSKDMGVGALYFSQQAVAVWLPAPASSLKACPSRNSSKRFRPPWRKATNAPARFMKPSACTSAMPLPTTPGSMISATCSSWAVWLPETAARSSLTRRRKCCAPNSPS